MTDCGWTTISIFSSGMREQMRTPRSAPAPCSSGWRCRPRSWRPSSSSDGRPPGPASPPPSGRGVHSPERAARGGQDQPSHPSRRAVEHLEDGVVLAIDRQQRGAVPPHLGHHQRAGADQALLVGEGDHGAAPDRGQGRLAARRRRRWRPSPIRPAAPPPRPPPRRRPRPRCRCRPGPPSAPDRPSRIRRPRRSGRRAAGRSPPAAPHRWLAVSASTVKRSGDRPIRSTVLAPTEPVAPRMVTERGRIRGRGRRSSERCIQKGL